MISNSPLPSVQNIAKNQKVSLGQLGLFAAQEILPFEILLTVKQQHTLCYSTICPHFKSRLSLLEGMTIDCHPHPLGKKISLHSELLVLYLIHLKTSKHLNPFCHSWLNRSIHGLYFFDRKVIDQTENLDLLINYVALQNHLNIFTKGLFQFLSQQQKDLLFLITNSSQTSLNDFKELYIWSYHFINSRSFGYTSEYTLIPIFDMMNHSSSNDNVQQIISDLSSPSQQQILSIISQSYETKQSYASDNDSDSEEQSLHTPKKIESKFLDLYYHVISTQAIHKNQEILIKYGSRNNMFLMQGYGFVQEYNKFDSLYIYFSTLDDQIYYDSVKGTNSYKFKFKRYSFDINFIITLKKHYFSRYYGKDHKKEKILWTVPRDSHFEDYFIVQILKRMSHYGPKVHYISPGKGQLQIGLWEKERKAIFQCNFRLVYYLYQQLHPHHGPIPHELAQRLEAMAKQEIRIPQPIQEYGRFLKKIET